MVALRIDTFLVPRSARNDHVMTLLSGERVQAAVESDQRGSGFFCKREKPTVSHPF